MFDPRDDARDRDGREDGRARVYDERDRDDDPREGLKRGLDLPRGEEREMVAVPAREPSERPALGLQVSTSSVLPWANPLKE